MIDIHDLRKAAHPIRDHALLTVLAELESMRMSIIDLLRIEKSKQRLVSGEVRHLNDDSKVRHAVKQLGERWWPGLGA